jgi:hypothetical protein
VSEEQPRGPGGETSGDGPGEGEWLTVAAAARRLGVSPRAIRSRIERGTLRWKAAGNVGKLVWLGSGEEPAGSPGEASAEEELELVRAELAETRIALARAEERVEAAQRVAAAEVRAAKDEMARLQADLERERARADRLETWLMQPWWRRWWR